MDNKRLSLREEDEDLLNKIYATMTSKGRALSMSGCNAFDQKELKGKTEAYHFQYYKNELLNGAQQKKLDTLLKVRGIKAGIRAVEGLPTIVATSIPAARTIFECFADAKDISQPECLLELLALCDEKNFPLVAFENDGSGLKNGIEDLSKYIADSKSEDNLGKNPGIGDIEVSIAATGGSEVEFVYGEDKWLDPYNSEAIPFIGRDEECRLLDQFAEHADLFKIWAIAGPSGAGKTRLAIQWAMESTALANWDRRVLHKEDRTDLEKWTNWLSDKPTLIIIDYMYGFDEVVLKLMRHRLKQTDSKVRLLLLDHVFSEPLHSDKRWGFSGDWSSLNRNEKYFHDLKPLDLRQTQEQEQEQEQIIRSIIACRAGPDIKNYQIDDAHKYLRNTEGAYYPLFAALVGDAIRSDKDFKVWNRRKLIGYYLFGDDRLPWKHGNDEGRWASHFISVATMRRGVAYEDLEEAASNCASAPEHFGYVEKICQKVITDDNAITLAPFEPDILGESFFLQFLQFIKKSKKYNAEFRQVFMAGNENTRIEDAIEFIAFILRLTRNLLNDDQSQSETVELWQTLFDFMHPSKYGQSDIFKWALTAGLVDIVDAIQYQFPEEKLITLLNQADPAVFYRVNNSSLIEDSVVYSMHCFELTSKLTNVTPVFSEEMAELFDQYTTNDTDGETPLILASSRGFNKMINALINRGVDIEATLVDGQNALMVASLCGQIEAAKKLFKAKVYIHAADNEGRTALVYASAAGHANVAKLLLEEGAEIDNAVSKEGMTALMYASSNGHANVVKLLLEEGAETDNTVSKEDRTALMHASSNGHANVVKLLLKEGANIHTASRMEGTALMCASVNGHADVVKLLLVEGADIHTVDSMMGYTVFSWACIHGYADVVKLFLEEGADIHAVDNEGRTVLLWASAFNNVEVVKLLLKRKARIDVVDNNGLTALSIATAEGHKEMINFLVEHNAKI